VKACVMLRKEQYAAMTLDDLQDARRSLLERKRERAGWEAVAISDHARDGLLRTKREELEKARDQYRVIARSAENSEPNTIVARLIAQAAFEEYIRCDIENLENAKKIMDGLDEQLSFCDTAILSKNKQANTAR